MQKTKHGLHANPRRGFTANIVGEDVDDLVPFEFGVFTTTAFLRGEAVPFRHLLGT
jgi:hypothetical protein